MAMKVSKVDVWVTSLEDRPGSLAGKLAVLAEAGANLAFVLARRAPDKPGTGVAFLTPLSGRRQLAAARKAGCRKTHSLHSVRVDAPDRPGLGARMTAAVAKAGINLRGLSAMSIGRNCQVFLAFDKAADATKAAKALKAMR